MKLINDILNILIYSKYLNRNISSIDNMGGYIMDFEINDSNITYISQFGSYGTNEWIKNISDIDIGVIVVSVQELDYYLEDKLINHFKSVYNYDNINITFTTYDLDNKLARNIICGKTIYSTFDEKELKRRCLNIEKVVCNQRNYYEMKKLQKLKSEVSNLW